MFLAISPTVKVNRSHVVEVELLTSTEQVDDLYKFRYLYKGRDYLFTSTSDTILLLVLVDDRIKVVEDKDLAQCIYECL